ncbi:TVP38/TMEM64 family protein [Thermodesulfobacteriota bacterium]
MSAKQKVLVAALSSALVVVVFVFRIPLGGKISYYYHLFSDQEQIKFFLSSFGWGAPLIFIIIQIGQVMFAPVPGEATGFIGGYLFGTALGFLYSSIGLTVGSWINFLIGRLLGKHYVRKMIPRNHLERFDRVLKRQGIIVVFLLFVFPGFPKDFLSLFLGLSTIPLKAFILVATVGRMPGTLMLSLQGAFLYEKMYGLFLTMLFFCFLLAFLSYWHRENIYRWIEKLNSR